ncbi:MAG: TonB family protein [Chitinispirillaceae bacterium]|nr:TonB family protein [Chitinispirillaceae bacterium]
MDNFTITSFDRRLYRGLPISVVVFFSISLHFTILVGIPLLSKIFYSKRKFERPKTFQLVASPFRPAPSRKVPVQQDARKQRLAQPKTDPIPSSIPDKSASFRKQESQKNREAAKPIREDLDELSSILDEIPAPATVSAVGNFKYHWYLNNVQQKIERYWTPSSERKDKKVTVNFTIYQDGTISEPKITASSGDPTLDNLALRAVKLASPFGKLPPGFESNKLELNCILIPTRM